MASSSSSSTTSSSSSISTSPNPVIANIANLIPIKLDSTNFLLWKSLFKPTLRSHHLEHIIDNSKPSPPRKISTGDGKTAPNPEFITWSDQDQTLLSWINATLSDSALPYILAKEMARDAWESLEHRYGSLSRSHVLELKKHLQHIKKQDSVALYWSVNTTHKDPEYFPEPEKFDPSRFEGEGPAPYTFNPFGGGPRMCPGKEFAKLQILVFLHNLVKRFRWEAICPNEKIEIDPMPSPVEGLPLRLHPHHS